MLLGGFLVPLLGVFGMAVFSFSLFFNLSLVMLWLYLELSGLCLILLFFYGGRTFSFSGLYYYIIFSGVSSGLLLLGILIPQGLFFLLGGLLMKFGVFPLWGWVYRVCGSANWGVIWGLSTMLKASFILFPLFLVLGNLLSFGLVFLCSISCFFLSFLFWFYVYDWKICWCHIMLSSSSVLVALSISGGGLDILLFLYLTYFFWSSLVLFYLSYLNDSPIELSGSGHIFAFCFLLLAIPVSLPIFYKAVTCFCIFSSGFLLLFSWVLYSISEQFYLFLYITGFSSSRFSESFVTV